MGIAGRVHLAGFVPDADLPAYLQAADICACLRWPTNGETSASWLRLLAAGRATVITDLAHQPDVPVRRCRGPGRRAARRWPSRCRSSTRPTRCARRFEVLARESPSGGPRLGTAARAWWQAHHTLAQMADAYVAAIARGRSARPAPRPALPAHLDDAGGRRLAALLAPYGVAPPASVAG